MLFYKGIDVSEHQGVIDWEKVKAAGIEFAIIRAGYGQNNIDNQFTRNIVECNRLGIPAGIYWFSYALTPEMAAKEAAFCLEAIRNFKIDLPVFFDFEYDSITHMKKNGVTYPDKNLCTSIAVSFLEAVEQAGYYAGNYTNAGFTAAYFTAETLKPYDHWAASWYKNPDFEKPPVIAGIWQYTSSGTIPGITGRVDCDISYKDYPGIIAKAGLNQAKKAPEKDKTLAAYEKIVACGGAELIIQIANLLEGK